MGIIDLLIEAAGLMLRFFPWRSPTGLFAVGSPEHGSPVLVSCNYRVTVRRLRRALKGHDAWLLVADSGGINVWCASSGGHLTNGDLVRALTSSGIEERVDHRRLVLPGLSAPALEPRVILERTGWEAIFGPVHMRDLPRFMAYGSLTREVRSVTFRPRQRLEVGAIWGVPMGVVYLLVAWALAGLEAGAVCGSSALIVSLGVCLLLPWVPVKGWRRLWTTFGITVAFTLITAGLWSIGHGLSGGTIALFGLVGLLTGGALTFDLAGTTPDQGSGYLHTYDYRVELEGELCTGAARCVLACPRGVIKMKERRAFIAAPDDCVRCAACIVQCPEDALFFTFQDGTVIDAATARSYKLDLHGRRTVRVGDI